MAIGDEDVAGGANGDVGGLIESVGTVARDAGFAESLQDLALGAELDDLMAFTVGAAGVGDPEIIVAIDGGPVGEDEHAASKPGEQFAGAVELEDGVLGSAGAGVFEAAVDDIEVAGAVRFDGGDGG